MYKIAFLNQGKVYELFCRQVASSNLYGFIEVSKLVFETDDSVVIDPTEEKLRDEFAQTETLFLPIHGVIRIEKVTRRGTCAIREQSSGEKVTPLHMDGPRRKR